MATIAIKGGSGGSSNPYWREECAAKIKKYDPANHTFEQRFDYGQCMVNLHPEQTYTASGLLILVFCTVFVLTMFAAIFSSNPK